MVMRCPEYRSRGGSSKSMARQKHDASKSGRLRSAVLELSGVAAIRRKRAGATCKGIKPDESTDRPGNCGRAGHCDFAGRRSDVDAAQPPDEDTAARGHHEIA